MKYETKTHFRVQTDHQFLILILRFYKFKITYYTNYYCVIYFRHLYLLFVHIQTIS